MKKITRKEYLISSIESIRKEIIETLAYRIDSFSNKRVQEQLEHISELQNELNDIISFEQVMDSKENFDDYINRMIDEKLNNSEKRWQCGCLINAYEKEVIKSGNGVLHVCCEKLNSKEPTDKTKETIKTEE